MKFSGNVYEYLPYPVAAQTTTVRCTSSSIESYSKVPTPMAAADSVLTYGPYKVQPAYAQVRSDGDAAAGVQPGVGRGL